MRETKRRNLCAMLPLLPEIVMESVRLSDFRGDPADRIIVATARHANATRVTADGKILEWAAAAPGRLNVLPL